MAKIDVAKEEISYTLDVRGVSGAPVDPVSHSLAWNVVLPSTYLAGDYNLNGNVDAADYVVWRNGLNATFTQNDYNVWRTQFGQTLGNYSAAASQAAVPEPATVLIVLVGTAAMTSLRGRNRRSGCA